MSYSRRRARLPGAGRIPTVNRRLEGTTMYVRLATGWTDPAGVRYVPGEWVDVDVVTLAELEQRGVVAENGRSAEGGAGRPGRADPGEVVAQWSLPPVEEPAPGSWRRGADEPPAGVATVAWSLADDEDD